MWGAGLRVYILMHACEVLKGGGSVRGVAQLRVSLVVLLRKIERGCEGGVTTAARADGTAEGLGTASAPPDPKVDGSVG